MRDPARTVVLGPLEPFAGGFVVELSAQGYTAGSAVQQMCLMAHLSRWLEAEGLGPAALSPAVVERFCCARRAAGYGSLLSSRALDRLLAYLRRLTVRYHLPRLRPPVSRIDNAYGDRNLFCACPPIEEIDRATATGEAGTVVAVRRPCDG